MAHLVKVPKTNIEECQQLNYQEITNHGILDFGRDYLENLDVKIFLALIAMMAIIMMKKPNQLVTMLDLLLKELRFK